MTASSATKVTIESAKYRGVYLRMEGDHVTKMVSEAGGTVNLQFGVLGAGECFMLSPQGDSVVTVESVLSPGVFLRSDGNVVNGQFGVRGKGELFRIVANADGTVSLESVFAPGKFVCLLGAGVTDFKMDGVGAVCAKSATEETRVFIRDEQGQLCFQSIQPVVVCCSVTLLLNDSPAATWCM